ncbi:MAG TPA: hypothetical protein VK669_05045 [Candidatus Limnocylindrales bacterium]|nr:hypothetical protein [Candidatus Limnocylindrales bacterium]
MVRFITSIVAAGVLLSARVNAQTPSPAPPTLTVAAPAAVSGAFSKLNANSKALSAASPQSRKDFSSLVKVQAALKKRVENVPVSDEYADSLARDANALARAKQSATTAGRIAATRPAERDLNAKYNQASKLDATTIGEYGDTVMVTVKTMAKGTEVGGYFVLANYWLDVDKAEPSFIFGDPTPCHREMTPGFYYFWVNIPGKHRVLIEREISGTSIPPSQTIYLEVG